MENTQHLQLRLIGAGLLLCLLVNPPARAAAQQSPTQPSSHRAQPPADDKAPVPPMPPADPALYTSPGDDLLPDSPGAVESAQLQSEPLLNSPQPQQARQAQSPAQQSPREPLGTAAAETIPTVGVAASKPAGAALAPAKQRRIRTILIRTGAVLGAAAAVGVTMALTEGSPSKPPGAH